MDLSESGLFSSGSGGRAGNAGNQSGNQAPRQTKEEYIRDQLAILSSVNSAIFDCASKSFGSTTLAGLGLIALSLPILPSGGKFVGATAGTSIASSWLAQQLPKILDENLWAPTMKNPGTTSNVLGRVLARWVPYLGELLIMADGFKFTNCLFESDDPKK